MTEIWDLIFNCLYLCAHVCWCVFMCVNVCLCVFTYRNGPAEIQLQRQSPDPPYGTHCPLSQPRSIRSIRNVCFLSLSLSLFISFIPVYQCSISLRLHSRTGRAISSVPISCVAVKLHNLTGHSLFVFPCLPVNLNIYFIIIIIIIKTLEKSRWQNSLTRRSFLVDSITGSSSATKRALKWVLFRQIIFLSNSF